MSDHPRVAQRNLRKMFICDDIWLETFHFFGHAKVALEVALVSDRFDTLVAMHFRTRKWALGYLSIACNKNGTGAEIVKSINYGTVQLPFPKESLPTNVVGFRRLVIYYVDHEVIAFLHGIRRLFNSGIVLDLKIYQRSLRSWDIFANEIWPQLNPLGITAMRLQEATYNPLKCLRTRISPTILRDCSNLQSIRTEVAPLIGLPSDDSDGASDGQALFKWLHTPRGDGTPKILKNDGFEKFLWTMLKKTFLNATFTVSFIIVLAADSSLVPFELDNVLTRERLTLRRIVNNDDILLLERAPIERNAQQWDEWEAKALGEPWINLIIHFLDNDIGHLSPPAPTDASTSKDKRKRILMSEQKPPKKRTFY